jgi:hypothetical protein
VFVDRGIREFELEVQKLQENCCGRTREREIKKYNGEQQSTRMRMEHVVVICEVGRLAIAL